MGDEEEGVKVRPELGPGGKICFGGGELEKQVLEFIEPGFVAQQVLLQLLGELVIAAEVGPGEQLFGRFL